MHTWSQRASAYLVSSISVSYTHLDVYKRQDMLWFAILPFMTFAPVLLLWLSRWMRSRKQGDFITRAKNDPDLQDQLRAASLYARNLRSRNAHCGQEEGCCLLYTSRCV